MSSRSGYSGYSGHSGFSGNSGYSGSGFWYPKSLNQPFYKRINIEKSILYAAIIILFFMQFKSCGKSGRERELENLITAMNDTMRTYQNENGNNVATIQVLSTEKQSDFLKLKTKDKEIQDLQAVVKDYKKKLKAGSSVTNFTTKTTIANTGKTTSTPRDTVYLDGKTFIYPEYSDSLVNEWIYYKSKMNKDSSHFDLELYNKYSAIVGFEKGKPFVDVINYNPYSTTTALRTYQVSVPKAKPKKFGIGIQLGVSLGSNFQITPTVGVGLSYNLIRF